jgi:hypothetical protein
MFPSRHKLSTARKIFPLNRTNSDFTEKLKQTLRFARHDPSMNTNRGPRKGRSLKLAGAVVGAGAVVALGALAVTLDRDGSGPANLAGSGHAPTNSVFVQPTGANMNMGATATTTTPPTVPAVASAKPSL